MEVDMIIQYAIVALVFVCLALYVVRKIVRLGKGKDSCCSCCEEKCIAVKSRGKQKSGICDNCS